MEHSCSKMGSYGHLNIFLFNQASQEVIPQGVDGHLYIFPSFPSVIPRLSCRNQWTCSHDFWYGDRAIARCEVCVSIYITYISVSKSTPLAVAGPHGQLASFRFHIFVRWKWYTSESWDTDEQTAQLEEPFPRFWLPFLLVAWFQVQCRQVPGQETLKIEYFLKVMDKNKM